MKPAKFDYHRPATIDEAIALLERYQGEARALAGGQSLVPMMNFRLATTAAIVDLNRIPLPADTPIIDERFKDRDKKSAKRSGD